MSEQQTVRVRRTVVAEYVVPVDAYPEGERGLDAIRAWEGREADPSLVFENPVSEDVSVEWAS